MRTWSVFRGIRTTALCWPRRQHANGFFGVRFASTNAAQAAQTSHTSNALLESRWAQLEDSVRRQERAMLEKGSADRTQIRSLFESIYHFQKFIYDFERLNPEKNPFIIKSNELLGSILRQKEFPFDGALLEDFFRQQPSYPTLETVIKAYYARDPKAYVDERVAMIPFRKFIWDGSFNRALDYVSLTTGNERFFNHRKQTIKRVLGYFGGSMAGLILGIHGVVTTFYPELIDAGAGGTTFGIYGIYACIVTYFINCGFLATLSFSSRGMENGPLMFQHYTMPHDWYMKVEEMKMCAKVLEADAEINGLDGFATKPIVDRIHQRGFEVNEPEQEIMLRQYWYSSGDGFAWVEPDVDPAEQRWYDHLEQIGVKKVWERDLNQLEADATSETVADDNTAAEGYFPNQSEK